MYDLVWKSESAKDMADSGQAITRIIQNEFGALHPDCEFMRGIAIFDKDQRLVDLRIIAIAEKGQEEATLMGEPGVEDGLALIGTHVRAAGCTDFMVWTYGEDSNIHDADTIGAIFEVAQTLVDCQAPHGISLRAMLIVGRTPGAGGVIAGQIVPTPGSPTFVYHHAERTLEIEMGREGGPRPEIVSAMNEVMAALREHRPWNKEMVGRAAAISGADLKERALAARASGDSTLFNLIPEEMRQAMGMTEDKPKNPFELPPLNLPKPDKGLLN